MNIIWARYKNMGGPLHRGTKECEYNPPRPWGVWTQIIGVVARCEGRHDTVVMYDETGVTFGFLQWTFKAGRLQKLLEFLKGVPSFVDDKMSVFDANCRQEDGKQIFENYGFSIHDSLFITNDGRKLNPRNKKERDLIVDICMGRRSLQSVKRQKDFAKMLCKEFVVLGQSEDVQSAITEYAKIEFKRALDYRRPPLKGHGDTIRGILPEIVWSTPIPAIFFNLFQNAPFGAMRLFKNAWNDAFKKGIAFKATGAISGYGVTREDFVDDLLAVIWRRLNRTRYADWGFRSRQYINSGGKNPPRIERIKPAIKEFYGIDLPYYK